MIKRLRMFAEAMHFGCGVYICSLSMEFVAVEYSIWKHNRLRDSRGENAEKK